MTRQNIENTFAAVAFAEAGEHETAMKMAGIRPVYEKVRSVIDFIERSFAAVGFAEAGLHEEAIKMTHPHPVVAKRNDTLDNFLETVGLGNVRVCYGLATV
ncbi:MAG: hypothetical protein KGY61_02400 [Desulfobacterales bacterium]|nr:hypothetical protein [Desulfobacterales bacterium]